MPKGWFDPQIVAGAWFTPMAASGTPDAFDNSLVDVAAGGVNGTATPAGVAMVAAVGTAVAHGSATKAVAGVAMTAAVGTPVGHGSAVSAPQGVSLAAGVGSPATAGSAVAQPAGVGLVLTIGVSIATGDGGSVDATASPAGVGMVLSVGTVVASGTTAAVSPPPIVPGGWQPVREGPGRGLSPSWAQRDYHYRPDRLGTRVDAVAVPVGAGMTLAVGVPVARVPAMARPSGVGLRVGVGTSAARGARNLADDELAWLLAEVA